MHTQGKLHIGDAGYPPVDGQIMLLARNGIVIAVVPVSEKPLSGDRSPGRPKAAANASRLALCWNHHDALVRALKLSYARLKLRAENCTNEAWKVSDQRAFDAARAVLADIERGD